MLMAFHLKCETCLRLWADYGAAMLNTGGTLTPEVARARRIEASLKALQAHEAEAHPKRFVASA